MSPECVAQPRAIAVVFTALVLVAALLAFTVGARAADEARNEKRPAYADLPPRRSVTGLVSRGGQASCGIPLESTITGCEDSTLCHHGDASGSEGGVASAVNREDVLALPD
jgi:hypothetical protein